jgi:hypothetical protein
MLCHLYARRDASGPARLVITDPERGGVIVLDQTMTLDPARGVVRCGDEALAAAGWQRVGTWRQVPDCWQVEVHPNG